jgi:hypothetical protein
MDEKKLALKGTLIEQMLERKELRDKAKTKYNKSLERIKRLQSWENYSGRHNRIKGQ